MIPPKVRAAVLERAAHSCERCGRWLDVEGGYYSLQHRRARGAGGSKRPDTNTAVNLAALCGSATTPERCHLAVEAAPEQAILGGWRVPQWDNPALVPIEHHTLGPVYLTAEYSYASAPPAAA